MDPTQAGRLDLEIRVGVNGEVISADVSANPGSAPSVAACFAKAARTATFVAPPAPAAVHVPIMLSLPKP